MSENLKQAATEKESDGFQMLDHYERLIKLRSESPDDFLLRTSQATRAALVYYEQQKARQRVREVDG